MLGGNSLTIGMFNIAHGDFKKTLTTLNYLPYKSSKNHQLPCYINDGNILGLLKPYRAEIIQLLTSHDTIGKGRI